jgi:hypothetical protein
VSLSIPALVLTLLAGCAPGDDGGLPEGVSATLVQQRSDVAERQIQLRVRNDSDAAITVGDVSLDDDRFDGSGTRVVARESSLAAGASVDVRVALPPMDCAAPDEGAPRATLHLVIDGEPVTASSEVADALDALPGIHARECLGERLSAVAAVEVTGFDAAPAGEPGMLHLAVAPTGAGSARLVSIDPTPLLTYSDGPAAPYALDREVGARPEVIDIPLVPQRCDPHVVQEDKRGTIFTVHVEVDGSEGEVDLAASADLKARLLTWVATWCGFGS